MPFFLSLSLLQTLAFLQDRGSHSLRASSDPDAQSRSAAASNGRHGVVRCAGTRRGVWVEDCYVDLWWGIWGLFVRSLSEEGEARLMRALLSSCGSVPTCWFQEGEEIGR
jgi:hypothetical protein